MILALTRFALAAAVLAATAPNAPAELTPVTDEFKVNTSFEETDTRPRVAMDAAGNFVVVWLHFNPDSQSLELFGQRFDNEGNKLGGEFRIDVSGIVNAPRFDVAMDSSGSFVVVWEGPDDDVFGIRARLYDADGNAIPPNDDFVINDDEDGVQAQPVATFSDSGFVVAWNGSSGQLIVRSFGTGGLPGPEQEFTFPPGIGAPAIAGNSSGEFVVAWQGYEPNAMFPLESDIYAMRFDSTATPVGQHFRANTFTTASQRDPVAAMNESGDFVIAWEFGYESEAAAQAFHASGNPDGGEMNVSDTASFRPTNLGVAMDADTFTTAYELFVSGPGPKIEATRFMHGGGQIGDTFTVHMSSPASRNPDIASDGVSRYVVVYDVVGNPGTDVTARLYTSNPGGSTTTTTTTMPATACGDADGSGGVTATDALLALSTAVGSGSCPLCLCDVDSSGTITAADALRILNEAVGLPVVLTCVACGP